MATFLEGSQVSVPKFNAVSLFSDDYVFNENPFSLVSNRFSDIDDYVSKLINDIFGVETRFGDIQTGWIDDVQDWLGTLSYEDIPNYSDFESSIDSIIDDLDNELVGFPDFPAAATFVPVEIFDNWSNIDDSPPAGIDWDTGTFTSDIYSYLVAKIVSGITGGGTGLPDAALQAQWDGGKRRLLAEADAKRLIARNEIAAGGFSLPPGALNGRQAELDAELLRQEENINDTITVEQAKLAEDYSRFVVDSGVQLETVLREFFTSKISALIARNEGQVSVWRTTLETQVALVTAHAGVDIEQYKANVDRFKAEIAHHGEYIKAWTDYIRADVDRRSALMQALMAKIDQHVKAYLAFLELHKSGLEFRINVTAQFVASLLNSTNVGATTSYGVDEGRSETVGHRASLSEAIEPVG